MKLLEKLIVRFPLGLCLRNAAGLVNIARRYPCQIHIQRGGIRVDARSLINLLKLSASAGSELVVFFDGEEVREASKAIREFLEGEPGNP